MNQDKIQIQIVKCENAVDLPLPAYMSDGAAGMDLFANVVEETILKPGMIELIPTGIRIAVPSGYEAQIRPRSGLALKYGIGFPNSPGTIDADYRGEVKVIMMNWGQEDFHIHRGDRIAQMVINKVERAQLIQVADLEDTERGTGGFGHTGK
ncbi:MAG TPA: dUTP diphosphatase [Lachnospiraceae bacterium]|nr:dUTP diphosphatase [Lachnospiraceae bacterium]